MNSAPTMTTIKLRSYQRTAIDAIKQDWQAGYSDVLLTAATGAGKTAMFLQLLDEVLQEGQRAMVLAHRKELIDQPYARLGEFWPHRQQRTGIVMAETNETWAQIIIATVQTLQSQKRLAQILSNGPIDYLVVDEAHHCTSASYVNIIAALKDVNPNLKHLGATATPIRADGAGLRAVYQKESAHYGIKELVKLGYLAPPALAGNPDRYLIGRYPQPRQWHRPRLQPEATGKRLRNLQLF